MCLGPPLLGQTSILCTGKEEVHRELDWIIQNVTVKARLRTKEKHPYLIVPVYLMLSRTNKERS